MNQILLIDKPAGLTSFGVVARIRRVLTEQARREARDQGLTPPKRVKVGHAGTLDPFATGLLIVMAGQATKKCQDFMKKDKEYLATLRLGATSTTGDPEGEITEHPVTTPPTIAEIQAIIKQFTGEILQRPPAFSAIKVNGRRAYDLARQGQPVELPARPVTIYELEIISYHYPELVLRAKVSSGTYIRSLAEDIGKALQTGAYLTALRRTRIADFSVDDATSLAHWLDSRHHNHDHDPNHNHNHHDHSHHDD